MKMTNDKRKALTKYVAKCQEQLISPVPSKHVARGSVENYKKFLKQEIEMVKTQLAAEALAVAEVGTKK